MFESLKHRNFRLYLAGQLVSLIGTWMQQLATSWLIYRLTSSTLWLGISVFSTQIPMFLFGWMSGIWIDRADKRKLLIWTQSLAAIQALTLAILTLTHHVDLIELLLLSLFLGCINAIDMPTRQSFVVRMIDLREDLPNAIALNSSVMNGTRLIGPAIGGVAIAVVGEGPCFLLNALSYVAVIIALLLMDLAPDKGSKQVDPIFASLRAGFRGAYANVPIRNMLLFLAYMSVAGLSYSTLFPALAERVTSGSSRALGAITAAGGLGALIGALALAKRKSSQGLIALIGRASIAFSLGLIAIGWSTHYLATLFFTFGTALSMILILAAGNTIIQTYVEDSIRGRVMSLFSFSLLGTAPFGSLGLGWLAQTLGISWALTVSGVLSLMGGLTFAWVTFES